MRLVGASGTVIKGKCLMDAIVRINNQRFGSHTFFILTEDSYLKYILLGIDFMKRFQVKIDIADQFLTATSNSNQTYQHKFELKKNSFNPQTSSWTATVNLVNEGNTAHSAHSLGEAESSEEKICKSTPPLFGDILCKVSEDKIDIYEGDDKIEVYDIDPKNLDLNHLTPDIQEKVRKVILENIEAFAKNGEQLGQVPYHLFNAKIPTREDKFAWSGVYKRNPKESQILDKLEKKMLRMGVFGLNTYLPRNRACNMVVLKPGQHRLNYSNSRVVSDFCKLNQIFDKVTSSNGILPNIELFRLKMNGWDYITHVDIKDAFWCIQVDKNDTHKLAVSSETYPNGYHYRVLPMGIKIAPAILMSFMFTMIDSIEDKIDGKPVKESIHYYMDDMYLATKGSAENHISILNSFLKQIIKYGLLLKMSKSHFLKKETKLLGFTMTPDYKKIDEDKVAVIKQFARPVNKTELRGFLGLVNYVRVFIKNFSLRAAILYDLLKKTTPEKFDKLWTSSHEEAFIDIKNSLMENTKLNYPRYGETDGPFYLTIDSSLTGTGSMLSQARYIQKGGKEVLTELPIGFGAQRFSSIEKTLSPSCRELLGVAYGLKRWEPVIRFHHSMVLKCDCSSLVYLKEGWKNNYSKLWRIITYIDSFDNFKIVHYSGKSPTMRVADCLSRLSETTWENIRANVAQIEERLVSPLCAKIDFKKIKDQGNNMKTFKDFSPSNSESDSFTGLNFIPTPTNSPTTPNTPTYDPFALFTPGTVHITDSDAGQTQPKDDSQIEDEEEFQRREFEEAEKLTKKIGECTKDTCTRGAESRHKSKKTFQCTYRP